MTTYAIRTSLLPSTSRRPVTGSVSVAQVVQLEVPRLERVVGRPGLVGQLPDLDCRRSPTARRGGRAARSRRRTPPRPSAPRSRAGPSGSRCWVCRFGGTSPTLGSAPCLVTLVACHSTMRRPRLVDDAAIFPPGQRRRYTRPAPTYGARSIGATAPTWSGRFVVRDTDLPLVRGIRRAALGRGHRRRRPGRRARPGSAPKLGLELAGLEIALRDLDDLAGNARRVATRSTRHAWTARWPTTCRCTSSCRTSAPPTSLAGRGRRGRRGRAPAEVPHRRAGGRRRSPPPHALASWIDAALDRETPFKCTAGLHHAVRHTGDDGLRAPRLPQRAGGHPARVRRRRASTTWWPCWRSATAPRCADADRWLAVAAGGSPPSGPARSTSRWPTCATWGW